MMNYTFGLNEATPLPEDESYSIDVFDEEQVAKDIETAKSESDVGVVILVVINGGLIYGVIFMRQLYCIWLFKYTERIH